MVKVAKRGVTVVDRISSLPDHIKHDILSRLDTKDAVRTSVLSRSWRHEWCWLPCLNFDGKLLSNDVRMEDLTLASSLGKRMNGKILGKKEAYVDFLDRTLLRRSSKGLSYILQKLYLYVPVSHVEIASHVDLWLDCAMECGVRKLYLYIPTYPRNHDSYQLAESTLNGCFLTWLKLVNCNIISKNPSLIRLSSLQKLSLVMVYVTDRTLRHILISCCCAIKKLSLVYCFGFDKLEVSGVPKLEKAKVYCIHKLERVVFHADLLQTFVFEGCNSPGPVNLATCKSITHLHLNEVAMTDDQLSFHLSKLHLLEDLCLNNCNSLMTVKIVAPNLKYLSIKYCSKLRKVEIDARYAPNLESFTYWGDKMFSLSLNMPRLDSAAVTLKFDKTDNFWLSEFIMFLKKFNCSTTLTLCLTPNTSVYIPENFRRYFNPPLSNVEHMKVQMCFPTKARALADIIDTVLWLSPHPSYITVFFTPLDCKIIMFHFKYEESADNAAETDHNCCSSIPNKCWRHSLKKVKIDNLTDMEDAAKLKALFENSETLKRIEGLPL